MPELSIFNNEVSKESKLFTFLVVFMAWANSYLLPGFPLGVGEFLLCIFIPFYCKNNLTSPMNSRGMGFILWFFYTVLVSLVFFIYLDAPLSKFFSIIRVAVYWVIIFVFGTKLFNLDYFKKLMITFLIALSLFIITQSLVFKLTGIIIPGIFLNASLTDGGVTGQQMYDLYIRMVIVFGIMRPNGFLCEPAHCCQLLFIGIIFLITDSKMRFSQRFSLIVFFSISSFLTTSTSGLFLLCYAWFLFFCIEKKLFIFRIPLLVIGFSIIYFIINFSVGSEFRSIERFVSVFRDSDLDNSSNLRLNNGKNMISALPFFMKIFGTGFGSIDYVMNELSINSFSPYLATFYMIPFMSGFIGAIIWNCSLFYMFIKSQLLGKSLVFGYFILSLGSGVYCSAQMVWFFLLIMADIREKNETNFRYTTIR